MFKWIALALMMVFVAWFLGLMPAELIPAAVSMIFVVSMAVKSQRLRREGEFVRANSLGIATLTGIVIVVLLAVDGARMLIR